MDFKDRILVLDGAMGTMIQKYDLTSCGYQGNNDMLNILRPEIISDIHLQYLEAGADIITTNTFNSNRISQKDYGCEAKVGEMNLQGAQIAREAVDGFHKKTGKKCYVVGSMGPTNKMLTLSSDVNRPEYRAVDFDIMSSVYIEQASALIEGGVDALLVETIFDLLNAKAALYAIRKVSSTIPIMISASVNDRSGRILSGHTVEALYTALSRYGILSFGLNCSFGAKDLMPLIEQISKEVTCAVSLYPNAGLPNEMGQYDESPCFTAHCILEMAQKGMLDIVGGCCGTTPEHIREICNEVRGVKPREVFGEAEICDGTMKVCGLERLSVNRDLYNFINIGERTNVAGSAKFAKLIAAHDYATAANIARKQIEDGATIIDINMDDAMLDGPVEMESFLRYINNDPDIAKVPYMIDSSHWETILKGLKNSSGKAIVNSISLKEGEKEFLRKASEIYALGAAVIVMAFDEEGQAVTYRRKTDICQRAYDLLTKKVGFPPTDIIFDANILTIATGMEEHNNYAVDFIKAVKWIKTNLPGCKTSGGVSNLSFAFRGNNPVREAMHSVFLYHAINAGLDMAIVNPSLLQVYDEIPPELLRRVEAVILNTSPSATDSLVEYAQQIKNTPSPAAQVASKTPLWREKPLDERLEYALVKGDTEYLPSDLEEAIAQYKDPVLIIEGPLMSAMNRIGTLFSEGKMFLPQVVKSAKAMKTAVTILQPRIQANNATVGIGKKGKVLVATAKGDVHDIGKNIVSIVLSCNNIEVIDLGVMVDNRTILEEAIRQKADVIGISGLITPSLAYMEDFCRMLEENKERIIKEVGHLIPLIIGGATTSSVHTAVKLATIFPEGSGNCVAYGGDASHTALICNRLLSADAPSFIGEIKGGQKKILDQYLNRNTKFVSLEEARSKVVPYTDFKQPDGFGDDNLYVTSLDLNDLIGYIDWCAFLNFWGFQGTFPSIIYADTPTAKEAEVIYDQALAILGSAVVGGEFEASLVLKFYKAFSRDDSIVILEKGEELLHLPMPRQTEEGSGYHCLADYFPSCIAQKGDLGNAQVLNLPQGAESARYPIIGLFALKVEDLCSSSLDEKDFEYILRHSICARLTEAFAEWMTKNVTHGATAIRPAFGYPICPDHTLKRDVIRLLDAQRLIGISLTETCAMIPETSLCGMLIVHPDAHYFDMKKKI